MIAQEPCPCGLVLQIPSGWDAWMCSACFVITWREKRKAPRWFDEDAPDEGVPERYASLRAHGRKGALMVGR